MSEINYNINLDYDPENEELAVILNNADNFCNALELADIYFDSIKICIDSPKHYRICKREAPLKINIHIKLYAPLGYLNTKDENYRSTVILDEVRAPIITKLFEEYATGNHSIDSIWQLSKTLGLYTKMKSRRGNFVSKNTIYDILYDIKKASIDKEIKGLEDTKEKYKTIDNDTKDKIVKTFTIAGNISYIFQHASPSRQNELLKMLLKDCQLNGKRLEYTLRKPFDTLIKNHNIKEWSNIAIKTIEEIC